ncbi:hypothetical protein B0H67DRAFT_556017 [Lasiosphaeris hirsuta]|uniref:Allergen n=1 Tax=Lasiosphaeris hirsuta TaxID=260670 RepID=A0AA40A0X1_9PEZI|nr:hypothetical protein B0H67DRAFT_556017 [Lasiosphaeris hirsuta]
MDKTKKAVGDFMSKAGHHDTTVHEKVAPAIKHETIKPTQHEEINTAVDQEVHQDHYHRTVQPVQDQEVLPEQHRHKVAGTVQREFDHRDQVTTERALKAEAGKLRNEREIADTSHTYSRAPVVQGEHVHHHVHETVQPLVQKEIIQPEVVHTTVPVHEVHHNTARHHPTSELPPVSMDEFEKKGGALGGAEGRTSAFEGCPKGRGVHEGGTGMPEHSHAISSSDEDRIESTTSGSEKPSLMDRLNPYKDADGDGKKGFMK